MMFYVVSIALFLYKIGLLIKCAINNGNGTTNIEFAHYVNAGIILFVVVFSTYILMLNDLKAILSIMLVQAKRGADANSFQQSVQDAKKRNTKETVAFIAVTLVGVLPLILDVALTTAENGDVNNHTEKLMLYDGVILALFSIAIATISGIIVNQMTQIAGLA